MNEEKDNEIVIELTRFTLALFSNTVFLYYGNMIQDCRYCHRENKNSAGNGRD